MKGPGEIRGIAGLVGRAPVVAVLRVGRKDERGAPINKDRFYFAEVVERNGDWRKKDGSTYKAVYRPEHPDFAHYHALPPAQRREIRGVLVHDRPEGCWEYARGVQELPAPWPKHPQRAPACRGDGKRAYRFFGDARPRGYEQAQVDPQSGYAVISCETCPYLDDEARTCRPKGRFLFRLDQPGLPPVIVRVATQSWYTVSTIQGFFDHVEEQGGALSGGEIPNLYGLPFVLRLTERSTPKGTFPVVTLTPAVDLQRWLLTQRQRLAAIQGRIVNAPRLSDADQQAAAAVDFLEIEPTRPPPALPAPPPETYAPPQRLLEALLEAQDAAAVDAVLERYRKGLDAARKPPEQRARLLAQAESLALKRKAEVFELPRKPPLTPAEEQQQVEALRQDTLRRTAEFHAQERQIAKRTEAEQIASAPGPLEILGEILPDQPLPPPQALPEPLDWIRRAGATTTAGDVAALELEAAPHLVRYHPDDVKTIRAAFTSAKKRAANAAKTATGQFGLSATEAADQ